MNKKWSIILTVCALFTVLVFAGCYEPTSYPEIIKPPLPPAIALPPQHRIAGTSVQRRPIMALVLGQGPDVTFILASIHGNERAGTPLVRQLAEYLKQHPYLLTGRKVVLLPVANPDGMAHNGRFNVHGVDLNRNFAAANRLNNRQSGHTALSEPEARAIDQLIRQYTPDRIVSIHQPWACIDYDGPGTALAVRMAQYCDLPIKKVGALPGSLGSYAGLTLGIPIITFEMLQSDSALTPERLWQRYGTALIAAIVYPDTVK
ncbi:MAG: DUF2817 domain-containing protein [Phycisphaerales bacterium]|nr:MAG: DUF2817 domain-containing protein [Phycisphaerales bacterium]